MALGRIEQNNLREFARCIGGIDATVEALSDDPRQIADMIQMSMRENDRIERSDVERSRQSIALAEFL